ncbi:hypothetical protein GQ53DRAFT_203331 [Thozetella sp. PMI_491]|nr:hypothetical protein GQ53DRAFT_203331 [Thozetella sp. PMI_491]
MSPILVGDSLPSSAAPPSYRVKSTQYETVPSMKEALALEESRVTQPASQLLGPQTRSGLWMLSQRRRARRARPMRYPTGLLASRYATCRTLICSGLPSWTGGRGQLTGCCQQHGGRGCILIGEVLYHAFRTVPSQTGPCGSMVGITAVLSYPFLPILETAPGRPDAWTSYAMAPWRPRPSLPGLGTSKASREKRKRKKKVTKCKFPERGHSRGRAQQPGWYLLRPSSLLVGSASMLASHSVPARLGHK